MSDSFGARSRLELKSGAVSYFRLKALLDKGLADPARLPFSIKVLLEAVLRNENGREVTREDIERLAGYDPKAPAEAEIPFKPARVLMQDFTGVPALVDLAALRSAMARQGKDAQLINPEIPVDLVIDHSVQVDEYGTQNALNVNAELEFARNRERYEFLHWGQKAFDNLTVVPPASGICHQVNLEYLGKVVQRRSLHGEDFAFPDTLVGTDSHTPMINGLGVLGWGVGGIEAEAAMLGQPIYMLMPGVIGVRLHGAFRPGTTATDLVLTVTQVLRKKGVVGRFIEFCGRGLSALSITDRATVSNMAPEYGATCGFFPVDAQTLDYLRYTGRTDAEIELVEAFCREQELFRTDDTPDPEFMDLVEIDLADIVPSLAGPKRPQDRVTVANLKDHWKHHLQAPITERGFGLGSEDVDIAAQVTYPDGGIGELKHGDVVIASITSCTNTSNPAVMIGAGLLAKKAVEAGLEVKPYVKTSLAPGSKVVTRYLDATGLTPYLDDLGFQTVGYGCATCIGNSGPLPDHIVQAVKGKSLVAAAVLSGNRNFEGRINPHTRANYLASPPLVVAYALAGTVDIDLENEPLGIGENGRTVFLKDVWPASDEIAALMHKAGDPQAFEQVYSTLLTGNDAWNAIPSTSEAVYDWKEESTYIQEPPFFIGMSEKAAPIASIEKARVLVMVGDSVTTDHISPAGSIDPESPAGRFLIGSGIEVEDFNSYGSRRGNDRVMTRGTFANIRLRNQIAPGTEGGWTTYWPTGEVTAVYDASIAYAEKGVPLIVLAGQDYGMGSSRDWAAKGSYLLGIRAVLAQSFERIHRSNLVGMGVLPLQFKPGQGCKSLGLTGDETFDIGLGSDLSPGREIEVGFKRPNGGTGAFAAICRIDTPVEIEYFRNGGILHAVLRRIIQTA